MGNTLGIASDGWPGLTHAQNLLYLSNSSQAENSCFVGEAGGLVTPGFLAAFVGMSRLFKETFPPGVMHVTH